MVAGLQYEEEEIWKKHCEEKGNDSLKGHFEPDEM